MSKKQKLDKKNTEQINKLLAKGELQEIFGVNKKENFFANVDISSKHQCFFKWQKISTSH